MFSVPYQLNILHNINIIFKYTFKKIKSLKTCLKKFKVKIVLKKLKLKKKVR